ncbi:MAG: prsD [Hyphomicrobiales bacterium]|nr:prsD [Hyphomicrobiales bacterium]
MKNHPLTHVLTRSKRALVAVAVFSAGINILILTGTIYMMQIFDRVLTGQSGATLFYLTLLALFLLSIYGLLELVRSRILVRLGTWLETFLSPVVLSRGLESCVSGEKSSDDGLRDLATLRQFISGPGLIAVLDAPWAPIYLLLSFFLHPIIGAVTTVAAIILFGTAILSNIVTSRELARATERTGENNLLLRSAFRNAGAADGLGMLPAIVRRWYAGNGDVLAAQQGANDRMGLIGAATKFFRSTLQIIILAVGAWLVLEHQLTAGGMTAASIIMARALAPVEGAVASWKQILSAISSWGRLGELLQRGKLHASTMQLPRPTGHLQVDNLSHALPGATAPVLLNVHFEARPGEVLAIIGPSGAGKSTLARLITGLVKPARGAVRLDGSDIFAWDRNEIGRHVGYLPQETELFPGTIRENIARLETDPDPEKVLQAARIAGVHELIQHMPQGYDTPLVHNGANLSGGQRQRVGLARAIYGNPSLLVLDEPDAHLDARGDQALNEAIRALKESGSTIVLVAHRPSMMRHVDRIVVLDEGRLQLVGPKAEVLAKMTRPDPAFAKAS